MIDENQVRAILKAHNNRMPAVSLCIVSGVSLGKLKEILKDIGGARTAYDVDQILYVELIEV